MNKRVSVLARDLETMSEFLRCPLYLNTSFCFKHFNAPNRAVLNTYSNISFAQVYGKIRAGYCALAHHIFGLHSTLLQADDSALSGAVSEICGSLTARPAPLFAIVPNSHHAAGFSGRLV